ncbi:MAG: cyclic nucleotide-gated ion channel [Hyphomicrobiales bacterium]
MKAGEHPETPAVIGAMVALLDRRSMSLKARLYRRAEATLIMIGILAMVVGTTQSLTNGERFFASAVLLAIMILFVVDALMRMALNGAMKASQQRTEADAGAALGDAAPWTGRAWGALDILTVVPMALAAPFYWTPTGAPLLASLWLLRFARYSAGGRMLATVIIREREPILGVLLLFGIVLTGGAVLAFLAERQAQPEVFTSVGTSLWWAITTLTTTGYGDMAPVTLLGRMVGGCVMIGGLGTISLLAGILATGFSAELKRTEFLRSWDMISKVSFFENAGAATIADVAALLRPRDFPPRSVVVRRGQPGDCMYFIVEGEVEVLIQPKPIRLASGAFFGEMAILTGAPRNATIVTTKATQLLSLDIADFRALAASRPELTDLIRKEADLRLGKGPA